MLRCILAWFVWFKLCKSFNCSTKDAYAHRSNEEHEFVITPFIFERTCMNIRGCMRRIKHFSTTSVGHQASFKQAKGRTKERKKTFTSHTQCRDSRINWRESTQRRGPVMRMRKSCFFNCAMRHIIFFFFFQVKYFLTRGSTICKTYRRVSRFFQFLAPFDNNLPDRLKLFKGRLPSFRYSQSSLSRSISVAFVT